MNDIRTVFAKDRSRRSSRLLLALVAALAMLAVLLPAAPQASATGDSTTMAEVAATIGADELWALGYSGDGIDVAVIDTGVNPVSGLDGPGKVVQGPDLSFEAGLEQFHSVDTYGHGTTMASIIAGNDGAGFLGIAPDARILAMKVSDNRGAVDVSQVIAALDWVVEYGQTDDLNVRVINLSYSTNGQQSYLVDPLSEAIERAWEAGYVVVVSAGNDGVASNGLANPALDPFGIAVAAAEGNGVADFSNMGTERVPDVMAPGYRILGLAAPDSRLAQTYPSALIDGRFLRGSGTSQAAAVVSGAAALLLDQRPGLTPDQVKALIIAGAVVEGETTVSVPEPLLSLRLSLNVSLSGINNFFAADPATHNDPILLAALDVSVGNLLSNWEDGSPGGTKYDKQAGSGMINIGKSLLLPAFDNTQDFAQSDGSGLLEAARGDHHVPMPDGSLLQGEITFLDTPWTIPWTSVWTGGAWSSASWTSGSWSSGSWSGSSWNGSSWSSGSWSSGSWSSGSWSSGSWSSGSWSSGSWSSGSWSSGSWSSGSWSSGSWSGAAWS